MSAGKITLDGLERVTIDDVQKFLHYLEWEGKEQKKIQRKLDLEARRPK